MFFGICEKRDLKLSAKKRLFYIKEVKFCRRFISDKGYKVDPHNMEAIWHMTFSTTEDQLCQFIHCYRLITRCIPDFHRISQTRIQILEKAYVTAGKTRKSVLELISLSTFFGVRCTKRPFRNFKKDCRAHYS